MHSVAGGVAKTADFLFWPDKIRTLANDGCLERIRHGYYQLADNTDILEEQLLAALIPEGIVCVESVLFCYVLL